MNATARPVEAMPPHPGARAAGLGLQPPGDEPPGVRAHPAAELADRLSRQPDPQPGRLRDLRSRAARASWCSRARAGEIRAFHNVCRHRGARLLEGAGNCPGAITCPYHGWSYKLTRRAARHAHARDLPAARSRAARPEAGAHAGRFRLRIRMPGRGRPAAAGEDLGGDRHGVRAHHFEDMVPLAPLYVEHWDCDWKIAMDNYLESYHVPIGHPGPDPHVHARLR